jgi:GntR family transcriptional regulator
MPEIHRRLEEDTENLQVMNGMTTYQAVRESFIGLINKKKYKIGDRLPSENELAKTLRVSRVTLRESIRQLREDGFIYSRRGSGTYVSGNVKQIAGTLDVNNGLTRTITEAGFKPGVADYQTDLIHASQYLADKLRVKKGCRIVLLKRVRTANDKPVVFSQDYLSPRVATVFLSIDKQIISLFEMIEQSGITIGNSFAELSPESCTKELAQKLSYKAGGPILALKQVLVDHKGSPLFYGEDYFRPDCFVFSINRKRSGT